MKYLFGGIAAIFVWISGGNVVEEIQKPGKITDCVKQIHQNTKNAEIIEKWTLNCYKNL